MKEKTLGKVISQKEISKNIFDMWIATDLADQAKPGQFIGVYPKDKSTILPRPISICEIDKAKKALRIVYRIAGAGTTEFSTYQAGDEVAILGTLGNGFPLDAGKDKKVFLIGGGIGVPPILEMAKQMDADKSILLGYRDGDLFLKEDFDAYGKVYVATEDGSVGTKGNVIDAIRENGLTADAIFACGPTLMLRALKAYAQEQGMDCYLSLEERMACGIGACLACVCKSMDVDEHTNVNNKRICKDGPVFAADEIEI